MEALERLRELATWLASTDICLLDLRGPQMHLRLRRDGGTMGEVVQVDTGDDSPTAIASTTPQTDTTLVSASSVGVFLHRHPLRDAPLARPGADVGAGQTLALLQIGALLLPVTAPHDGVLAGPLVTHGTAVGYGTPLLQLQPR
jgi:acetyl-CoA carboxylase biotin carboxyl carrier protein